MNNARVFRHGLVADTERVRIPEGDTKSVPPQPRPQPEPKPSPQPEAPSTAEPPSDEGAAAKLAPEPELLPEAEAAAPEFEPLDPRSSFTVIKADPVFYPPPSATSAPTKEELAVIFEKELAELKQAAAQEAAEAAYFDALKQKKSELRDSVASVQRTLDELISAQEAFLADYLDELKFMAIDIAEKMILEKISEDDMILQKLVIQSVRNIKNASWINVALSEQLVRLVDVIKNELESADYRGSTSVSTVTGNPGTLRIATEDGTLVGSIGVQAENLRKTFREADKI